MNGVFNGISEFENIIIESIIIIGDYIKKIEVLNENFKEANGEMISVYYADYWNVQLENLYTSLQVLKNIQYKKRKLLKANRFKY